MALSINSPADIMVTEGQAVNISWVASGGSESATYPIGAIISGFDVAPPSTNDWVNYEGRDLSIDNISSNQIQVSAGSGGTDRHISYIVTGENVVRVRSKYVSGAQYSQYVCYTFSGGDTRIWVMFVGFGEIRIYYQKNGGTISYVTVSGYVMVPTQISDISFHLKNDGQADYVISIYNENGTFVDSWSGTVANCYSPSKQYYFVFGGAQVLYYCQRLELYSGSPVSPSISYYATTTKNGAPYSTATNTTGLFPLNIPTAQASDAGTYAITVTNAGSSVSDLVAVVVNEPPQPEQYDCDDAFTRFLFEMTAREKWEPELSTVTSIHLAVGVISYFQSGEPESSYWKQWGGWYDNPNPSRFEVFVKSYLTSVQSMNELIVTPFSFYQNGETYINTPLFLWQYSRLDVFLAAVAGFSSSVRDTHNPSDDTYSGIRYPVRLKIPSIGMSQLPDPVNGVIPLPAFSVSLDNSDGYFDQFDTQRFFNSLVKLKKSTISRPNLSDFITIRTGKVDSVEISFSDYRVKTIETTRAFTMPVCRSIVADQFENMDSEIIGKALPVGYGPIKGCALIKIGEDENDFRYITLDPNYLTSVSVVYNSDGNSISFSQSGGVITSAVAADRADVVGKKPCRIADIVISEIELKAEIPYVVGLWDVSEVERYRALSPEISLFVTSGNLKKLIEQALSNDSAFQFSKNNGELTIRRVGLTYDYHKIPEWVTTQPPTKSFSESKDFCSSVLVNYLWDYRENGPQRSFLDDTREQEIFEIYTKNQRNIYDTTIQTAFGAEDLARRLLDRFSSRFEILKLGTGYDCSAINPLDTVEYPIVVNDRVFSSFTKWLCRACDPAQDKLELEQYSALETYIAGTASFPSVETSNGVASHVSIENESGETANQSIAKGN